MARPGTHINKHISQRGLHMAKQKHGVVSRGVDHEKKVSFHHREWRGEKRDCE